MKSAEIVENLWKVFRDKGLMTSPTAGIDSIKKINGRKVESFTFGIARLCDGVVNVYHKGFIVLKWQSGRRPNSETFHSMNDVVEWVNDNGWSRDKI
tara:strand:- start:463 stop:753 length:291 start_codon:yes stop_codon:yes gene_type:complete